MDPHGPVSRVPVRKARQPLKRSTREHVREESSRLRKTQQMQQEGGTSGHASQFSKVWEIAQRNPELAISSQCLPKTQQAAGSTAFLCSLTIEIKPSNPADPQNNQSPLGKPTLTNQSWPKCLQSPGLQDGEAWLFTSFLPLEHS